MSATDTLLHQPVAQAIAWALVQFLWQGALVGAVTWLALAALRASAADIRYVVASIGLALMLTMPTVTAVQTWRVLAPAAEARTEPAAERGVPRAGRSADGPAIGATSPSSHRESSASGALPTPPVTPPGAGWTASMTGLSGALLMAWACGVLLLSLRLVNGWWWVQRMKNHGSQPARDAWQRAAARLSRRLHVGRPVRLLETARVDVPTVIGWLRPVVLLPTSAVCGLTPQQLEAILAHELAHIRRHDYLVNLLQTLVETLLFYHPAVWWVSHRIRVEREHCCDDLAVNLCGDPYAYAQALADLEGLRESSGRFAVAVTGGSLLQRVRRLLGAPSHAGRCPGWLAGTAAALLLAGMAAGAVGQTDERQPPPVPPSAQPHAPTSPSAPAPPPLVPLETIDVAPVVAALEPLLAGIEPALLGLEPAIASLRPALEALEPALAAFHSALAPLEPVLAGLQPALEALDTARMEALAREAQARAHELAMQMAGVHAATGDHHLAMEQAAAAVAAMPLEHQIASALEEAGRALETMDASGALSASAALAELAGSLPPQGEATGNFTWSDGKARIEVSYNGTVEFTDDDADVKSLSPGGWLRIREGGWVAGRTVEFTADASGTLSRRYWTGRTERPFEPEGRQWLAGKLPRIIRQSGLGARGRVERILRSQGVPGVLAEVSLIEGSWGKRLYLTELLQAAPADPQTATQVLAQAGREIDSDFELASFLISSANRLLLDDQSRRAYFEVARSIDSDFELRRVCSSVLKGGPLAPDLLATLLDTSTAIGSDFEAASLLVDVVKAQPLDARTRPSFFKALAGIDSDFEHRRVLTALARSTPDEATTAAMLESAGTIGSDFEQASLLLEIAGQQPIEGVLRAPFFKAVEGLDSSFERGRVLKAVAGRPDSSSETVLAVLSAARGIDSSFERSQVLQAVARTHQLTGAARDAYISAAEHLGEFEQSRALAALVKGEKQ
ncbi:MAG TPA: M56 family metallopeptidase [Vicinamibacterales bacterium]|nr:M56 family metallopeptidase [Vicinamibacterales bacterium]